MQTKNIVNIENNCIAHWNSTINATEVCINNAEPKIKPKCIWFQMHDSVKFFTGRGNEMSQIHMSLLKNNILVVCGLGGIGKSELLRAYGWKYKTYYQSNVIWIRSETQTELRNAFLDLATELNIPIKHHSNDRNLYQIVQDIYKYFLEEMCLFIFDNVSSLADIHLFLPIPLQEKKNIHILISSQNTEWGHINKIPLNILSESETCEFIKNHLENISNLDENDIKKVANILQCFPLALQQAVTYISDKINYVTKNYNLIDFIEEFEKKDMLLDYKYNGESFPDYSTNLNNKTIFITIQMMLEKIKISSDALSVNIIYVMAYFSADNIQKNMFLPLINENDNSVMKLNNAIRIIVKHSLVTIKDNNLFIHRLVQKILRNIIKADYTEELYMKQALNLTTLNEKYESHLHSVLQHVETNKKIYLNFYRNSKDKITFLRFIAINNFYNMFLNIINTVENCDLSNNMLIMAVAANGNAAMMKLLVDRGIYIHNKNKFGLTVVHSALAKNNLEMIKYLVSLGADINVLDYESFSPLLVAAGNDYVEIVEYFIAQGANVNARTRYSPLYLSALNGNFYVVKLLIENGIATKSKINYELFDQKDFTQPQSIFKSYDYELLINRNNTDILEYFLNKKICSFDDIPWDRVFELILTTNHEKTVKFFIKTFPDRNYALLVSAFYGNLDATKALIQKGANIHYSKEDGCTALYFAAIYGHIFIVEFLISNGAKVNTRTKYSPLYLSALNGHFDVVKLLIENGITTKPKIYYQFIDYKYLIEPQNIFDSSDYIAIIEKNNTDILQYFLDKKICCIEDIPWDYAFELTLKTNHEKTVKFFIENFPDANYFLLVTAFYGNLDVIKALLQKGANIHYYNKDGCTALYFAAINGHISVVKFLISKGANINHTNKSKETALTAAAKRGCVEIVTFLMSQGAGENIHEKFSSD